MKSGSVLAGKYRLISILGSGGMGAVWRAEHLGLRAPVAVKLLATELDGRQDAIARFLREAQSAASLRSPHVVQVFDHGVDETTQTPFIAMELMEGESLADRLTRVTRLSPADTSRVITQAARALTRAHELGIVHRDLKPANLFLVHNEDDEILKVLDFGLAKWKRAPGALTHGAATATNIVMGTPYYMSPEQMNGARDADQRSDLWALGVIAFECLTGVRPFDGDNLISIGMKVCSAPVPALEASLALPPELDAWFSRALAKDPAQRFQTARELAEELRRVCRPGSGVSASFQPQALSPQALSPQVIAPAAVAAVPVGPAEVGAGLGGRTAPLVRAPLDEGGAAQPSASSSSVDGTSENARSAGPVARNIENVTDPERPAPRRRSLGWALGAVLLVTGLAVLGALRAHSVSAPGDVTASASPGVPAADPPTATAPASVAEPAKPTSVVEPAKPTSVAAPTSPNPVVVPVPDDSAPAAAQPSPVAPARSATEPAKPGGGANNPVVRNSPARRPTAPAPSSSAKGVDIERKPSF